MENKKDFFLQLHLLLFSAKWRKEEEKLALLFPKYRQSILLPMQAVFTRRWAFSKSSFCDWKNATQRMVAHESSKAHRDATMTLCQRAKLSGCVNSLLIEQCQAERIYAKTVLERVVATIKFLAERSLAFRGSDQVIGSPSNGNFFGIMELLSQFDPFLAAHLEKYGNKGKGSISYLSSTTCGQFIAIIGKEVLSTIIEEIKTAKYYSISVDSTPDIGYSEKLCCIFLYVLDSQPVERFVQFIVMKGQGASELEHSICTFLEKHQIKGELYHFFPKFDFFLSLS